MSGQREQRKNVSEHFKEKLRIREEKNQGVLGNDKKADEQQEGRGKAGSIYSAGF